MIRPPRPCWICLGEVAGLRLLEVAFGQGRVARELARRGAMPTGLDISTALLANVARLLRSGGWFVFSLGPVPVPFYFAARCLLAAR